MPARSPVSGPRAVVALLLLVVAAALVAVAVAASRDASGGPAAGAAPQDGDAGNGAPAPELPAPPTADPDPEPAALGGLHVVLDPGHNAGNAAAPDRITELVPDGRGGMKTCNTVGTATASGYPEHAFNWDVARRTQELLDGEGAQVTMTRQEQGVGPCVDERGRSAAEAGADVLVSIHANGSEDPAVQGFFVMVSDPPLNAAQDAPSRALAQQLVDSLARAGFPASNLYPEPIVGRADLATLNHAERPVVMLELAEMRNPVEADLAESEEGRQRYAEAVADAVATWATG